MTWYTCQELTLEVRHESPETESELARLLIELAWAPTAVAAPPPSLQLAVKLTREWPYVPPTARTVFQAEGWRGLEHHEDFYLTNGTSLLHVQTEQQQGIAYLAPTFFAQPPVRQRTFWTFALLKLLRPLGLYSLHAAGLQSPQGRGLLLIGPSGSGKSTLTLGLIRQGWRYVSDDAVLLRMQPQGVSALACRQAFYLDAPAAAQHVDLPLGEEVPDLQGGTKRRVHLDAAYPGRRVAACLPTVLIFSRIVSAAQSVLQPLDRVQALQHLLRQSGPQLFDRGAMTRHLDVLTQLVRQATPYELQAGRDLYHEPGRLEHVLAAAEGSQPWPGW